MTTIDSQAFNAPELPSDFDLSRRKEIAQGLGITLFEPTNLYDHYLIITPNGNQHLESGTTLQSLREEGLSDEAVAGERSEHEVLLPNVGQD